MEPTDNAKAKKRTRAPLNAEQKKSAQRATTKYIAKAYDRHVLNMPKGKKDVIKDAAEAVGESVNGYILGAVDMRLERDRR